MLSGYFMFLHVPRWLLNVAFVHWFQKCSMIFQFPMIFHVFFLIWCSRSGGEVHQNPTYWRARSVSQIMLPDSSGTFFTSVSVTSLGKVLRPIPPASFSRTAPMVGCWRLWFHAHPPPRKRRIVYIFNLFLHIFYIICIYLNNIYIYIFIFVYIRTYIYTYILNHIDIYTPT